MPSDCGAKEDACFEHWAKGFVYLRVEGRNVFRIPESTDYIQTCPSFNKCESLQVTFHTSNLHGHSNYASEFLQLYGKKLTLYTTDVSPNDEEIFAM